MATKFLKQYEILIKKATVDLNSAKVLLESFEDGKIELDLEIVFFHFQQSVEKILKAYLDFYSIKFPHTHDLKDLINLLNDNNYYLIEEKNINDILLLTQYAVEGKYAIIHDDLEDADKYIEILERLIKFVKEEIKNV